MGSHDGSRLIENTSASGDYIGGGGNQYEFPLCACNISTRTSVFSVVTSSVVTDINSYVSPVNIPIRNNPLAGSCVLFLLYSLRKLLSDIFPLPY